MSRCPAGVTGGLPAATVTCRSAVQSNGKLALGAARPVAGLGLLAAVWQSWRLGPQRGRYPLRVAPSARFPSTAALLWYPLLAGLYLRSDPQRGRAVRAFLRSPEAGPVTASALIPL